MSHKIECDIEDFDIFSKYVSDRIAEIEQPQKPVQTSNKTRFDLEQQIMDCWTVVDTVDDIYKLLMDDEFFEGMDPKHQDRLSNLLLGVHSIYEMKFDRTFKTFEACVKNKQL